jgi:hypothetical protein
MIDAVQAPNPGQPPLIDCQLMSLSIAVPDVAPEQKIMHNLWRQKKCLAPLRPTRTIAKATRNGGGTRLNLDGVGAMKSSVEIWESAERVPSPPEHHETS